MSRRLTPPWCAALVLVAGAVVLNIDLRLPRGSTEFLVLGVVLALVWSSPAIAFGPSGSRGRYGPGGDLALGALGGAVMFGVFFVGQAIGRHIAWLDGPIRHILVKADAGPAVLVAAVALINGVAEELFFRGALIDALDPTRLRSHVLALVAYIVVTGLVGNTALTIAAIVMGVALAAERWFTGALFAPIATHVVWSALVIVALPRH